MTSEAFQIYPSTVPPKLCARGKKFLHPPRFSGWRVEEFLPTGIPSLEIWKSIMSCSLQFAAIDMVGQRRPEEEWANIVAARLWRRGGVGVGVLDTGALLLMALPRLYKSSMTNESRLCDGSSNRLLKSHDRSSASSSVPLPLKAGSHGHPP